MAITSTNPTAADDFFVGTSGDDRIFGGDGADTLSGGSGSDTLQGGDGGDVLVGGAGSDSLQGGDGIDVLSGGGGNDYIHGGNGVDVAAYGDLDNYSWAQVKSDLVVTDRTGVDGVDRVRGVEALRFTEVTVHIDGTNNNPFAVIDRFATNEDTAITVRVADLLANDREFDGDTMSVVGVSSDHGVATLGADGTVTFIPAADASGVMSVRYQVSDGRGGLGHGEVSITVAAVADAPVLTLANAAGDEDRAIGLNIAAAPSDTDGSETLSSVVISGLADGARLSDGRHVFVAGPGTDSVDVSGWSLVNLEVTGAANADADMELTITATAREASNGATATTAGTISVAVAAVADAPIVAVANAAGEEDRAIRLDVSAALADGDGSESLSGLVVSGLADGAVLTDGVRVFTAGPSAGAVDILGWNLGDLSVTGALNSDADMNLTVTATAREASNGATATSSANLTVAVAAVADAPMIGGPASLAGTYGQDIGLAIGASLLDADGSESLSLRISGVPQGIAFSAGTRAEDGSWSLSADALAGLTLTTVGEAGGDLFFNLSITATSTESANGSQASSSIGVAVAIDAPEPPPPLGGDPNDVRGYDISATDSQVIFGTQGADHLSGGGANVIGGGPGDDTIVGGNGADQLYGGSGDDIISGGTGADLIVGGHDDDGLSGGNGADTYRYLRLEDATDLITDFENQDRINLGELLRTLNYSGGDPFADGWLAIEHGEFDATAGRDSKLVVRPGGVGDAAVDLVVVGNFTLSQTHIQTVLG
ncbi:MAG: cadherin-like domain-containing protein [Alphaproteobacteria bacterium]|nr:cadherin-like domain-containing protein [Alphaproteobacteria bacterium]